MSGPVTLTTLRGLVRKRADVEGATARWPDAEIDYLINASWNELYETISATNEDYYISATTITTAAGTAQYALAAQFLYIRTVTLLYGGIRYEMDRINLVELDSFNNLGTQYTGVPAGYTLIGNNMQIVPTPTGIFTVELRYVPLPVDMLVGADTMDGKSGWQEFVVWGAAAAILATDGRDPSVARAEMAREEARIVGAAQRRNMQQPKSIIRRSRMSWNPWRFGV